MGSRFMELLKNITIFLLAGQVILRFLPEGGYEKYARIIVGVMVLSQLALPLLSLGGFDARAVFSDTLLEYEQEMQRIEKQVEQAGLKEGGYVQDGLETALSDRLLDFCGEWGIQIVSAAVDEDGVLQLTVRDSEKSGKEEGISIARIQVGQSGEKEENGENGGARDGALRDALAQELEMEPEKLEVIWDDGTLG